MGRSRNIVCFPDDLPEVFRKLHRKAMALRDFTVWSSCLA